MIRELATDLRERARGLLDQAGDLFGPGTGLFEQARELFDRATFLATDLVSDLTTDLTTNPTNLKSGLALLGLLSLLCIPIAWWMHRRSQKRVGPSPEIWGAYLENETPVDRGRDGTSSAPAIGEGAHRGGAYGNTPSPWWENVSAPAPVRPSDDAPLPGPKAGPGAGEEGSGFFGAGEDEDDAAHPLFGDDPQGTETREAAPPATRAADEVRKSGGSAEAAVAPPDAAPEGAPPELIRDLVASLWPDDLVLAEDIEKELPPWAAEVVETARRDLAKREKRREPPAPQEYLRLGILEMMLGHGSEATRHLKEALRRESRLGPVLNALAVASAVRERLDPAISYCREALREAGGDTAVQAAVSLNLGNFYQARGDDAPAAEAFDRALGFIGTEGAAGQRAKLRMRVGRLCRRLGDSGTAAEHFSEAAHLFHRMGDGKSEALARVALASEQMETGAHELAQTSLEDALEVCRKAGEKATEALVCGRMGATLTAREMFTRALRCYTDALELNREIGSKRGEAANFEGMGTIHLARGDFAEARKSYEAALAIRRQEGDALAEAAALAGLGRAHFRLEEWQAAHKHLTEARRIFREAGETEAPGGVEDLLREVEKRLPGLS